MAKFTPAFCISRANACVTFLYRASYEPAQPTQKRRSAFPVSARRGISIPSAQSARVEWPNPHGVKFLSRFANVVFSSSGNRDSFKTRPRRRSTMVSTCSIMTGHSCTQAMHVVQAQSSCSVMKLSSNWWPRRADASPPDAEAAEATAGAFSIVRARRSTMIFFGLRSFPVAFAGQTEVQRPHSVHVKPFRSCFHVRSSMSVAPYFVSVSSARLTGAIAPFGAREEK